MRVPDFLVRQFYVAGSLQRDGDGFSLQARNGMGDGTLVGIRRISVDGTDVDLRSVSASLVGEDDVVRAEDVSRHAPVAFRRGDIVTLHIAGHPIAPGEHRFEVEILELNAGLLQLSLKDTVR